MNAPKHKSISSLPKNTFRLLGLLLLALLLLLHVPLMAHAMPQSSDRVQTVDRLCGRLIYVKNVDTPQEKATSLSKVVVRLYRERGDTECCNNIAAVGEVPSGQGGKFEFKKMPAGNYWIVTTARGHECKMLVRYEPTKRDPTVCSQRLYEVDEAGRFILHTLITLD
jgi:hypothetical protein